MDVHNYDKRLKKAIENVGRCDLISPGNRELILKFIEYKRAQGTGAGRCAKTLWALKQFATGKYEKRGHRSRDFNIMKGFGLLTKDDVQKEFARAPNDASADIHCQYVALAIIIRTISDVLPVAYQPARARLEVRGSRRCNSALHMQV